MEYCKQFDNCKGCPEIDKDFCTGMVNNMRQERLELQEKKRNMFNHIIEEMNPLLKEIKKFKNDRYKLILNNGSVFTYYPTTGTLINQKTKLYRNVPVYKFKRYFNF